ncbi:MAG TPA: hypothetical protein VNZ45_00365 [Bacteroidia bacterium]|nr:hypothetical protein [Bacteroidia bacterium]
MLCPTVIVLFGVWLALQWTGTQGWGFDAYRMPTDYDASTTRKNSLGWKDL